MAIPIIPLIMGIGKLVIRSQYNFFVEKGSPFSRALVKNIASRIGLVA